MTPTSSPHPRAAWRSAFLASSALCLSACNFGGSDSPPAQAGSSVGEATAVASTGQVAPAAPATAISHYAASRFAEQASFGPTPALVAELRSKGFARWIDEQLALPASSVPVPSSYPDPLPDAQRSELQGAFAQVAVGGADQLRLRVVWAMSQFIVVSQRKVDIAGIQHWTNLLLQNALGRYDNLLMQVSTSPAMGHFLDNSQNRPKSAECEWCAPNENYARELMQLFSIGVVKLNPDGTPLRDAQGKLQETYSQRDVEQLARVLTGWTWDPTPPERPNRNFANWARPMVPSTWAPERDTGAKSVLGTSFAAGQSQTKDLQDAVAMLMAHPNIAPFVATRLIQHLVKSNPTPAYVGRISAVFRNNGSGVAGDMKAVVKAILLDAEARAGDNPATARADDGKLREPFLQSMALWRGLSCRSAPLNPNGDVVTGEQLPFNAESVFSFYAPTDRAPGSNLLAPEQKLLNASEMTQRLARSNGMRWNWHTNTNSLAAYTTAGCSGVQALIDAHSAAPRRYLDLVSERFFRGAMPPTVRNALEQTLSRPQWDTSDPHNAPLITLDFALTSPQYGVIK